MNELKNHLNAIIENEHLTSLFQPIIDLSGKTIFGYEALIRGPSDSPLHNPVNLFATAERFQRVAELEQVCRKVSITQFSDQQLPQKLFLNVSPSVLLQPNYKKGTTLAFLEDLNIPASRVVIEITEYQPTDNYKAMRKAINHYRNMGFEIALDDLGAGYSGLRLWTELLPNYVKIDRHFLHEIDKDSIKLNFVRSIQNIAKATHCHVIAEGVETRAEFDAINKLGIDFAQGYYFARPTAQAIKKIPAPLFIIEQQKRPSKAFKTTTRIREILQEVPTIPPHTTNSEALKLFQKNSNLALLPLVESGITAGLIYKDQFLSKLFASRYGIDLHGNSPVQLFADNSPFIFDQNQTIEEVSQTLTDNQNKDLAFIITANNQYAGIGMVMDLLQVITTQQLQNAQHANPLTLLPGITPVNHIIDEQLANHTRFTIAYFDLDNFKPFNDIYGYEMGDTAIKKLAELLSNSVAQGEGYIGHIGGDDFIVVFNHQNWENSCKQILQQFEQIVLRLYKKEHILAGGIEALDRKGKPCFYNLLSLSIGIVEANAISQCNNRMEIADLATEAKHQAKKTAGNSYFINRRIINMIE